MTATESPTVVRWRSKYTGQVHETSLGSAEAADAYKAALGRSGHFVVYDTTTLAATPLIDIFAEKWALDEASTETPFTVPDLSELIERSTPALVEEVFEDRLTPEAKQVVRDFDERQKVAFFDGLEERSITELRRLSSNEQLGIAGAWGLRKPFLIAAIREARAAKEAT